MITPLPSPPQTSDPTNFATKADALIAALATFITQANTLGQSLFFAFPGMKNGLWLSTAGSSATMTIAPGTACDATGTQFMVLGSSLAKTTSSWTVGNAAGGLDTGTISNSTWYAFYEIMRTDMTVVDVLFSLSGTTPTMPTNYSFKRRIGWGLVDGSGHWTKFVQFGREFLWDAAVLDASGVTPPDTSAHTKRLSVPPAQVRATIDAYGDASTAVNLYFKSPDVTSSTGLSLSLSSSVGHQNVQQIIRTDSSGNISIAANSTSCTYSIFTRGWYDDFGED